MTAMIAGNSKLQHCSDGYGLLFEDQSRQSNKRTSRVNIAARVKPSLIDLEARLRVTRGKLAQALQPERLSERGRIRASCDSPNTGITKETSERGRNGRARLRVGNSKGQTDTLDAAVGTNKFIEGDDFSAQVINPTTRLKNYCQIARKDFVVTETANTVNTAGRKEELAYQIMLKGKALKRDIEKHLLSKENASAGTSASPRSAAAVETWIYTTNDVSAGTVTTNTTPAPVSGLASTAGTDGTAVAFIEADLKAALQQAWSQGGDTDMILLSPTLKNKSDNFTGVATRFRNVNAGQQADIVGAADVYVSSYGSHKIMLSRYCRASVVLCLDTSTWGLSWLRPISLQDIAKSGDSEKRMLVCEYTLVAKTPTANTKLTNLT